jgi:hypothetical protein
MIKLTQHSLDKLEEMITLAGYKVRHEKGNFKSGSCILEASKMIVLNKFAPVEAKVTYLVEAIRQLTIDESLLDEKNLKLLTEARQMNLDFSSTE